MPPQVVTDHDIGSRCNTADRHIHLWDSVRGLVKRCRCGASGWILSIGGALPLVISCEVCGAPNRINTAYEMGRADAWKQAAV